MELGWREGLVLLKEDDAVFLVKPGTAEEDDVAVLDLCKGVTGALALPTPPSRLSARSLETHIFSSVWVLGFITGFRTAGFCSLPEAFCSLSSLDSAVLVAANSRDSGAVLGRSPPRRMEEEEAFGPAVLEEARL